MSKTLFIHGSMTVNTPRGSISTLAIKTFWKFYAQANPDVEISELNLNHLPISQVTLNSENMTEFFADPRGDEAIAQLKAVDRVVMASPMTNFNYPAVIKNYLDHILVAKKTFIYKYDGKGTSEGLLPHLKVQIITSQGAPLGWYPFGDHTRCLIGTWKFVGAEVTEPIIIDGTKAPENLQKTPEEMIKPFIDRLKIAAEKF